MKEERIYFSLLMVNMHTTRNKYEAPETVRGQLTNPIGLQSTTRFIK